MTWAEGAFTIISAGIAGVIAIAAYFIDKWIKSVDESLRKQSDKMANLSVEVRESKTVVDYDKLAGLVVTKIKDKKLLDLHKMDSISTDVTLIKETLSKKVLPFVDNVNDYYGKIIVIEDSVKNQDKKLKTMFDALTKIAGLK